MECVPVAITLNSPDLCAEVTRYVEGVLGWQVIEDSPHFPAALILAHEPVPGRETIVIGQDDLDVAEALRQGATDALVWPQDAHRLAGLVVKPKGIRASRRLVISQAGSHVGASTLALGIGAIYAWSGIRVALAAQPNCLASAGMHHPGRVLACPNLWLLDPADGPPDGFSMVIVEAPLSEKTHVIVGRPDRELIRAWRMSPQARRVLSLGDGELLPDEVTQIVGKSRHRHIAWSQRIARAGLRGALPQGFPGRFLKDLATILGQPVPGASLATGRRLSRGHNRSRVRPTPVRTTPSSPERSHAGAGEKSKAIAPRVLLPDALAPAGTSSGLVQTGQIRPGSQP